MIRLLPRVDYNLIWMRCRTRTTQKSMNKMSEFEYKHLAIATLAFWPPERLIPLTIFHYCVLRCRNLKCLFKVSQPEMCVLKLCTWNVCVETALGMCVLKLYLKCVLKLHLKCVCWNCTWNVCDETDLEIWQIKKKWKNCVRILMTNLKQQIIIMIIFIIILIFNLQQQTPKQLFPSLL